MTVQKGKSKLIDSIVPFLKYLFAIGVFVYLFRSGALSVEELSSFFSRPQTLILALFLEMMGYLSCFVRWHLLLKSIKLNQTFKKTFELSMLGQFFTSFMPSNVGGDVVKAFYIISDHKTKKVEILSTILLDRVLGLLGLLTIGAVASTIFFTTDLNQSTDFAWVAKFSKILILVLVFAVMLLILFPLLSRKMKEEAPLLFKKYSFFQSLFEKLYKTLYFYRNSVKSLWLAWALSILGQCFFASVIFVVTYSIFGSPPWGQVSAPQLVMSTVIGFLIMTIPVSPGGWGVGQVAFGSLLLAAGAPSKSFGISLITSYQLVGLLINLCGFWFFVNYKKNKDFQKMQKLSEEL